MGALHEACLKSAADGPRAGRYTDFSGARRRLQKSAKIGKNYEKNRFSVQQLPKKEHFLKEMHKKKNRLRRKKKSRLRRYTAATPPGVLQNFWILGFCPYT